MIHWQGVPKRFCMLLMLIGAGTAARASEPCRVLDPDLEAGQYQGPCVDGLAQGKGMVQFDGNSLAGYEGDFVTGRREGIGRMTYRNGDTYEGAWRGDQRWGTGIYVFGPNSPWLGDSYEGQWKANRFHGRGRYRWGTGEVHEGNWSEGEQLGESAPGQARRKAYLDAFVPALKATDNHVCVTAEARPEWHLPARGRVVSIQQDRVQVEPKGGGLARWALVTCWRPCVGD